jgi:long-chain acyl-CoA synthetase
MFQEISGMTFPAVFSETVRKFGDRSAFSFVGEEAMTYKNAEKEIYALVAFLERNGIEQGDRVAILSHNTPNWPLAYFAITFMGAIVVPVLPDFSVKEVRNVLEHSESKAIFISPSLFQRIESIVPETLRTIISIDDFTVKSAQNNVFSSEARPAHEYLVNEDDLASIIYTSGTTGRSKGVMLTHKNIVFNAMKGRRVQYVDEEDRFLSVLPLSHTYENTLGLILAVLSGASIHYLKKPPTPSVLLPALEQVRPTMMLTVPLIIEKVYFNKILPTFHNNKLLNALYSVPFIRKRLNLTAGKKLMQTFGGELKFFGIGGAKLNKIVEKFLIEAKFPYAIGYGLTETSPLLAGSNPKNSVYEAIGPAIEGIELKINEPDKKTGEGEIWAKGPSVMKGYYKEPELTSQVLTPDGWFRTGDLGVFDKKNNLYIKGRLKNMILGSSGENIYPEEIESVINNFRFVVESLVIEQKGKLVALVHLNMEELEKKYQTFKVDMSKQIDDILDEIKLYVNSHVNKFSQIQKVKLQSDPFQKTATLKIKRFLYT